MKTFTLPLLFTLALPTLAVAQPGAEPLPAPAPAPAPTPTPTPTPTMMTPDASPMGLTALPQQAPAEKVHSINVSPLGLVFGNLAVSYEYLHDGTHGLVAEGLLARASGDNSSSSALGAGIGYRWHWRGKQNSGFLGVMFHQSVGSGDVTLTDDSGREMTYGMDVNVTTLTANVGKRWMLGDALNITLRVGLGYGHYSVNARAGESPEAEKAEKRLNDLLELFPVGFDGELSLGYTF
ncbi:MAG: DUF3575 domain-containing protein [Deltaproteobacteria bacterium]|nr:DUF3575 domain-containing protein [Deltaproteobacteria bacterium]